MKANAKNLKVLEQAVRKIFRPQPGPQEKFLSSPADIVLYGGSAGGGKSWGLLMEPLRHAGNAEFAAVIFRKNAVQVKNVGGLWDESNKIYPSTGARPIAHVMEWRWRGGARVKFSHLEYEDTVLDWQGSQIPLLGFDELTHFSESQFFYMLSRNRSMCGVRPYVRATCNPDADSWVAKLIEWWIDQETGYPIAERGGKIRWFIRISDVLYWGDSKQELIDKYGRSDLSDDHEDQVRPKSFTFIPAKLSDNKELLKADPDYRANLMALSNVQRERLLEGNWKIKPSAGAYFRKSDVNIVDVIPDDVVKWVRRWDLAATEESDGNPNPDWSASVLMGRRKNGRFIIAHATQDRLRSQKVRELVKRIAVQDTIKVRIGIAQDPGQAGKEQAESYVRELAGFIVEIVKETGDKVVRADPLAAQWQAGNVDVLRGSWNDEFFKELESFPSKQVHDDQVDAAAGAFIMLATSSLEVWARLGK